MFFATSLIENVICSIAEVVSSTDAAIALTFSDTSSLVAAISMIDEELSSADW